MQFRRGLPAAMPRPVDAVQHELDRAGVEQVDVSLPEAGEVALVLHFREVGKRLGEVLEELPVQFLGEGGVAFAVRVRQGVAVRHGRVAQLAPSVQPSSEYGATFRDACTSDAISSRDAPAPRGIWYNLP